MSVSSNSGFCNGSGVHVFSVLQNQCHWFRHATAIGIGQSDVIWSKFTAHLSLDRQTAPCYILRWFIWFETPTCGVCHEAGLWQGEVLSLQACPLQDGKKFVNASATLCGICSLLLLLRWISVIQSETNPAGNLMMKLDFHELPGFSRRYRDWQVVATRLCFLLFGRAVFSNGSKVAGKLPSQQMDNSLSSRGSNFKSKVCQAVWKKAQNCSWSLRLGMDAVFCFNDCSNNFSFRSNVWAA